MPERHGRKTLILLAAILLLGFGLRAYRVVEPLPTPGDDAHAYYALSKSLYTEGSFGGPSFKDPSDWSPGAPLLYAASFYATGGAREGTARIVELLLGLATIVVVYLLGRRISCRPAGLLAAFAVAVYPPFIHSVGALYSEPPAMFTLPAAVLAFLWASDGRRSRVAGWAAALARSPACLFGLTALIRPEYLLSASPSPSSPLIRVGRARGWKPGLAGARAARRRPAAADRPLDDPQPGRPRPHRADLHRRRQGALRRHLPARRRRIPAGQGDPRRSATCTAN